MTATESIDTGSGSRISWILIATIAVAVVRLATQQATHWEFDEHLFRMGVESFEPLRHHPHPPGYPLLIGLGQFVDLFVHEPFTSLLTLAWISSVVAFFAFAKALRELTGSEPVALIGALLFHLSPAMLVHGGEPMSDPPALMFLSLAIWSATRLGKASPDRAMLGFAASCAASIGCRPQYAVAIVPIFLAVLTARGTLRAKAEGLFTFTAVCLVWLVPLVVATGGPRYFLGWELGQAVYVSAHDAHLSRGTRSAVEILLRFVAHPWGPKAMAIPVLALAALGFVELVRRRLGAAWPLLALAAIHLAFTVASSDPADGVRYQLPSQMAVAFLAALGVARLARRLDMPRLAGIIPALLVVGFWFYARPVVHPRATEPSPPAGAVGWAREHLPRSARLLWDAPLRSHADGGLEEFETMPAERGLARYWDHPEVELWILADGMTHVPGARTFAWPRSDAYGKLTRNHYRVVSLIPLIPGRRYLPVRGVNAWERDADRPEWRWLDQVASLRLPPGSGDLRLAFELPKEVPYASAKVTVKVGGAIATTLSVARGASAAVVVPVPDGNYVDIDIVSSEVFTPAAGSGRDPRRLAITLTDLVRVPRSGGR